MKICLRTGTAAALIFLSTGAFGATTADIAFVIDQSGSMDGEWVWLSNSISQISTGVSGAGITARYAVAGYEDQFGTGNANTVYQDFTRDINDITSATTGVTTYGGLERSYDAAVAATTGISWDTNTAKVIILATDKASPQSGEVNNELSVGQTMIDGAFLLNVIAPSSLQTLWDEAVYRTTGYLGFFDLGTLRNDPEGFTADFTDAKIQEIVSTTPVPVPAAVWLFGSALLGLVGVKRRRRF